MVPAMKHLMFMFLIACGGGGGEGTGSVCPTDNPPTFDNFGEAFFATYCTSCHSATSANRVGAPADINFDSEAEISAQAADIDSQAAAGPDATNTAMPLIGGTVRTRPSDAERQQLGEYMACLQQ
jgi:uncharacterized membrane protein